MMPDPSDNRESPEYLLSQYMDGQLDEPARAEVERKLAGDGKWASMLADLRRVDDLVRAWAERIPVSDTEKFVADARLRRENSRAGRPVVRLYRWMTPLAAAAVLALLVTGWVVTHSSRPAASPTGGTVATIGPERAETPTGIEVPVPAEARPEAVVIVSFSRGAAPEEYAHRHEQPRLMATSGALVSADESGLSTEWSLF